MRQMFIAALLLTAMVFAALSASAQTCEYQTNWGVMTMINTGPNIVGSYTHKNGHLSGYMQNGTVNGTWQQYDGSGNFFIQFYEGGFTGSWNYAGDNGWRGPWNGRTIRCY